MPKGFTLWTPPGGNDFCPLLISLRSIKSPLEVFCDCRPANLIDQEPHSKSQSIKSPITKDILLSSSSIQRKRKRLLGRLLPQNIFCKEVSPRVHQSVGLRYPYFGSSRLCDISATSHSTLRHPHSFIPFGLRMCLPLRVQHPPYPLSFYCGFSDFPPHFRIGILREYTLRASLLFRRATPRPIFLEPVSRCLVALSSHKKRSHKYCTTQV